MSIYRIDPIEDPRWRQLTEKHPKCSVFHSIGWLKALQLTYGYESLVLTTSSPTEELSDGLVFCHVDSWLTGNRLVSLPFSDHCEPLFDTSGRGNFPMDALNAFRERMGCKYLEIRSAEAIFKSAQERNHFVPVASYFFHSLDLSPGLDELFQSLDKDSVQRRILRAERAGLVEEIGISDNLLKDFYRLFTLTRKRHHLPPSSLLWFQNLIKCQGSAVQIRVARKENIAVAAILTLRFKDKVYYKYGCSNARFHRHGAMPWLLWHAISDAKLEGARRFDFGRTEAGNFGLLTFKNHWAPNPKPLVYWRLPENSPAQDGADGWKMRAAKRIFSYMPVELSILTGRVFYRHFG